MHFLPSGLTVVAFCAVAIQVMMFPRVAQGANCPDPWGSKSGDQCKVDGTEVCTQTGGVWTCDLSPAMQSATIYVVDDYNGTTTYEAWGDIDDEIFCCAIQTCPGEIEVIGSAVSDEIASYYDAHTYTLGPASGCSGSIDAEANGNDTADTINGSDSTVNYVEVLNGGNGADTVNGWAGDDLINGDNGNDTLLGGAGVDEMHGGLGDDTMQGGGDGDTMDGDDGRDAMSGGLGDDTMSGGGGADVLCGDGDVNGDTLDDGDALDESPYYDKLWAEDAGEQDNCGNASTRTDGQANQGGTCGPDLASRPLQCP